MSSSRLRCQFTRTTEAPTLLAAAHTSKNSIEFGSMIATRSSAAIPRASSAWARRVVRASKSAKVTTRSPRTSAALSGVWRACSLIPIVIRRDTSER